MKGFSHSSVWPLSSVYPHVFSKMCSSEGLFTFRASEWSLSSVYLHVYSKIYISGEGLSTFGSSVWSLLISNVHSSVPSKISFLSEGLITSVLLLLLAHLFAAMQSISYTV